MNSRADLIDLPLPEVGFLQDCTDDLSARGKFLLVRLHYWPHFLLRGLLGLRGLTHVLLLLLSTRIVG